MSGRTVSRTKPTVETLPAGRYYIGDASNFLSYDIYKSTRGNEGHYTIGAHHFIIKHPVGGDGVYLASNNHTYDGNNISIVAVELGDMELYTGNGTFHTFTEPVSFAVNDGICAFVSGKFYLLIDTNQEQEPEIDDGYDSVS